MSDLQQNCSQYNGATYTKLKELLTEEKALLLKTKIMSIAQFLWKLFNLEKCDYFAL